MFKKYKGKEKTKEKEKEKEQEKEQEKEREEFCPGHKISFWDGEDIETHLDVLISVAMTEELGYLREALAIAAGKEPTAFVMNEQNLDSLQLTVYTFMYGDLRCAVHCSNMMAMVPAAAKISQLLCTFSPPIILSVGLSGSMDEDVMIGDVVIPHLIEMAFDSAAIENPSLDEETLKTIRTGDKEDFLDVHMKLRLSTVAVPANPRIHGRAATFNTEEQRDLFRDLMLAQLETEKLDFSDMDELPGKIRYSKQMPLPVIHSKGSTLCSDFVIKSSHIKNWLLATKKNTLAIDMESGAIARAANLLTGETRVVAIRGISDAADSSKKKVDKKGTLRRLAMYASVWRMLALLAEFPKVERSPLQAARLKKEADLSALKLEVKKAGDQAEYWQNQYVTLVNTALRVLSVLVSALIMIIAAFYVLFKWY